MEQALYRKYRSRTLDELVGQSHITTTLKNALRDGKISHAYLFTGPRGVGKTSVARILAHEVNQIPYTNDLSHLDIIEIDAASNRRIDEIRELRDRVYIAPVSARYKIYIIDEVHMLTKEAFNALLKTLEEPPEHVIFILATTEGHKLPETIISRTQRFNFKPIDDETVAMHLAMIAEAEKINISKEALKLIAKHGDGSFRDSISLLDQVRNYGRKIETDDIEHLIGMVSKEKINQLIGHILNGNAAHVEAELESLVMDGTASQIAKQLSVRLLEELVNSSTDFPREPLLVLIRDLIDVPASHDPATALLVSVVKATLVISTDTPKNSITETVPTEKNKSIKNSIKAPLNNSGQRTGPVNDVEIWFKVLSDIKNRHATLYSIARMAKPTLNNSSLILEFEFPFHEKRINEPKNKQIIETLLHKHTGKDCVVTTKSLPSRSKSGTAQPKKTETALSTISNIFGDAEVIES